MDNKVTVIIICLVAMIVCIIAIINGIKQRRNKLHLVIGIIALLVLIACGVIAITTVIH